MARGEYSHLLWQIRRAKAEHLGEDCWRVTLPGGSRTLQVRGTVWRLITILPKNWHPPAAAARLRARAGTEPIVPPALTSSDLIAELAANNPHPRQIDVELIVTTIFDGITDALARGGRVELRGFGTFTVKRRNARMGRNPRTGVVVPVDEKTAPYFKAGKELRGRLNRKPIRTASEA